MEAKLAEYRAKKRKIQKQEQRSQAFWKLLTLQPIRNRLAAAVTPDVSADDVSKECTETS